MSAEAKHSAVVLAGGRSTRMGQPKPLLKFGSKTLLERTVDELRRAFEEVVIVAAPLNSVPYTLPNLAAKIVFDPYPFEGPLFGLFHGLETAQGEVVFLCSCDLPMLRAEVGTALCKRIGSYDAVVPRVAGHLQPTIAAYKRHCRTTAQRLLSNGERSLRALISHLTVRIVDEDELRQIDPGLTSFQNINTIEEYKQMLKLIDG